MGNIPFFGKARFADEEILDVLIGSALEDTEAQMNLETSGGLTEF